MTAEPLPDALADLAAAAPRWADPEQAPSLSPDLLPRPLAPWLSDLASRNSVPLESVTVPAIVGLGAVLGASVRIRPDLHSDYSTRANLWGMVIERPGQMKSATVGAALKPVEWLDATRRREADERQRADAPALRTVKAEIAGIEREMAQAGAAGDRAALADLQQRLADALERQTRLDTPMPRLSTSDATIEKLGMLMKDNPRGMFLQRDELAGFLLPLDKPDKAGEREFYLEAWEGGRPYTVDRVGRGSLFIDSVTLSIFGTIQPAKIARYVQAAVTGNKGDDGLLQRFQMTVWPDRLPDYRPSRRWLDKDAKERAYAVYESLLDTDAREFGAVQSEDGPPFFRFDTDAQRTYEAWRDDLEGRLRSGELDSRPAFQSHLGKYRSLVPKLAMLFHLASVAAGDTRPAPVRSHALELAVRWSRFLEAHARKLYAAEESRVVQPVTLAPPFNERRLLAIVAGLRDKVEHGKLALGVIAATFKAAHGIDVPERSISRKLTELGLRDGSEKMGDGRAAMYWDAERITALSGLSSESSESSESSDSSAPPTLMGTEETEETEETEDSEARAEPGFTCSGCHGSDCWTNDAGERICRRCHPPAGAWATS